MTGAKKLSDGLKGHLSIPVELVEFLINAFNPILMIFLLNGCVKLKKTALFFYVGEFLVEGFQRCLSQVSQLFSTIDARYSIQHLNHCILDIFCFVWLRYKWTVWHKTMHFNKDVLTLIEEFRWQIETPPTKQVFVKPNRFSTVACPFTRLRLLSPFPLSCRH